MIGDPAIGKPTGKQRDGNDRSKAGEQQPDRGFGRNFIGVVRHQGIREHGQADSDDAREKTEDRVFDDLNLAKLPPCCAQGA